MRGQGKANEGQEEGAPILLLYYHDKAFAFSCLLFLTHRVTQSCAYFPAYINLL